MPGKVPVRFREEFLSHMTEFDDDSIDNDTEWLEHMKAAAHKFIRRKNLQWIYPQDAVVQYVNIKNKQREDAGQAPLIKVEEELVD